MERRLSRRDAARKLGACAIITSLSMIPLTSGKRSVFAQASTPAADGASSSPFAGLGLQTLDLKIGSNGIVGLPETLTAGRYLLHMEPSAGLPSQDPGQPGGLDWPGIMFIMIPSGMTLDDIAKLAATPTPGPPDWYYTTTLPGGVGGPPNTAVEAVVDFPAGSYFTTDVDFTTPPIGFTVTGDVAKDLPEPEANATITFKDYTITLTDGALKAGDNVIKIVNEGKLPHFLDLEKGPDSLTMDQLHASIETGGGTPVAGSLPRSDFTQTLGTLAQSAGTTQWIAGTLEAGTYMAACWEAEPTTGVPHAEMGMYTILTVQ